MASRLLLDDRIIAVQPALVRALNGKAQQAVVLQQLHYWLPHARSEHDGERWVYNTYEDWSEQTGLSAPQVRRAMGHLVEAGLVISAQPAGTDRTYWYRIDYEHPLLTGDDPVASSRQDRRPHVTDPSHVPTKHESTQESTQEITSADADAVEIPRHKQEPEEVWPNEVIQVTRQVAKMIRDAGHPLPHPKTKRADRWYEAMDRLLRLGPPGDTGGADPPDAEEVLAVAQWALVVSDFWPANVRSVTKLRSSWSQLRGQWARQGNGRKAQTSDSAYQDAFSRLAEREGSR